VSRYTYLTSSQDKDNLMTNKPDLYQQGFIDGAKYAIEYLMDLFDGIEETDIYKDYFNDEEETN
jgi:hypothetical protein